MSTTETSLRHLVLFHFKPEATTEDIARVEQAFVDLKQQIPLIQALEWGTDVSVEGISRGYSHCFLLTFASEADRDAYLPHPAHKAFGDILRPHIEQVLVLDYWVRN